MKKLINIIISIIAFLCILIVIKLSTLPLLPFLSEKSFWYSSEIEREKYSLIYSVCLSFFLSSFFYFLVNVIPDKVKSYRAKLLISPYVNTLLFSMEQIISILSLQNLCQLIVEIKKSQ